jgi:hypothetical protein
LGENPPPTLTLGISVSVGVTVRLTAEARKSEGVSVIECQCPLIAEVIGFVMASVEKMQNLVLLSGQLGRDKRFTLLQIAP